MALDPKELMDAIVGAPNDDAPRLVYADWLIEHGGDDGALRGELIQVQCKAAQMAAGKEREELESRARFLTAKCVHPELQGIGYLKSWDFTFVRGFAKGVKVAFYDLMSFAGTIFERAPLIDELTIEPLPFSAWTDCAKLADVEQLRRLRVLTINGGTMRAMRLGPQAFTIFVMSPNFPAKLDKLTLFHCALGDIGVTTLADAPVLDSVRELDLRGNDIGPSGASALAASKHLGRLERLDLCWNKIGVKGIKSLCESEAFPSLRWIEISDKKIAPKSRALLKKRFGDRVWFSKF
jgi:uncharacterized protein (TIGR02996 family)